MKLKEYVENFPDDLIINIGSKSAFFFIGTKAQLKDEFEELENRLRHDLSLKIFETDENGNYVWDDYGNPIWTGKYRPYNPIMGRDVKIAYSRIDKKENGINVIVEGEEVGRYYCKEEYHRRY